MGTPCTNCIDVTKLGCGPTTSDNVTYSGPNLPCSTINTKDTLTIAFQKIDALLCNVPGGQDLQQTLINGNTSTDLQARFITAANPSMITTIGFDGIVIEGSAQYTTYSSAGIYFSLNNTFIQAASPGIGPVNLLVPTKPPGIYTFATVDQIPNDNDLLHKTGDETKTGDLTVNAIIKAGGDAQEYLMADGSTSTISSIVTTILTPNILDGDTTHAPTGNAVYDALQAIIATIPANFAQIVYVNSNNPTTATIFDLNNPPVTNDNALKNDVDNLYIGTDASTWVYKTSPAGYVTYTVTSAISNFYITGTSTDAGGIKTGSITKRGELVVDSQSSGVSGFKLLQLPSKILKTNVNGLVVGTTFLQDVQYALDNAVIHNTGNELSLTGLKQWTNVGATTINALLLVNNGTVGTTSLGVDSNNSGIGIKLSNNSTGNAIYGDNTSSGDFIVANATSPSSGYLYVGKNNGTNTFTVDKFGNGVFSGNVTGATPVSANHLTTKAYVDALVVGLLDLRGSYDASTNLFPTTGGSGTAGAILKGDLWYVSVAGTLGGQTVPIGSSFFALTDAPGQTASNWALLSANLGYVPADDANVIHKTLNETKTGTLTVNSIIRAGGLATQFLKADGSIDSTTYATSSHASTHISGGSDPIAGQSLAVTLTPSPIYYTPINATLQGHLLGIDQTLGTINQTTAGISTRVYFTGDNTTVTAGTFFTSNTAGKGSTAAGTPQQTLVNGDNVKQYFAKDIISVPIATASIGIAGAYSGQLTVSSTPTPAATQQRFTIEVYKTNNGGTPIASGVTGAPVGDLGVTVVAILDSGLINVVAGSISNINLTGNLVSQLTLNVGERLRYHVSAQKVGTGGGNVTMNVYYGTNYNSYYDVPVILTTDVVINKSLVTGITTSDALNLLNSSKQPLLTNPVTGTGITGQVSFWNGTNTQTGDNALFWDNINKRLGIGNTLPTAAIDATAASTNTYTSFLTGILPPQEFGRISNSHNSGGTDQYASLILRVTGNLGANNALASISAIQPLAANGSSEMSLAVRSGTGQMLEAIRIATSTAVKINNLVGVGTRVVGVSSTGVLTPLSADMITGTGTTNRMSKWGSASTQVDSQMFDNGTNFVGINSTAAYVTAIGQTFSIRSTATDQGSTLELIGTSVVDGTPTGRIIFGNTAAANLPGASIYATRENGNSSYADLHFDIRGSGGYRSNALRIFGSGGVGIGSTATDLGNTTLNVVGLVQSSQFKLSALNTAPASATAAGTLGEIRIAAGFIYVCTATNVWVRAALATW